MLERRKIIGVLDNKRIYDMLKEYRTSIKKIPSTIGTYTHNMQSLRKQLIALAGKVNDTKMNFFITEVANALPVKIS